MYTIVFEVLFFAGISTMIYLVARALPRIGDDLSPLPTSNAMDRLLNKIPTERLDELSGKVLEKTLRRVRLSLLRLDNFLGHSLERVKRSNGNGAMHSNGKSTLFATKEEKEETVVETSDSTQ